MPQQKNSQWDKVKQYCHESFIIHESAALPYAGIYSGIEVSSKLYAENADDVMVLVEIRVEGKRTTTSSPLK